jgi:hypothetical protein
MKPVQKFEANDGTVFDDATSALDHDALCTAIATLTDALPAPPPSGSEEWIQHSMSDFLTYQRALIELFRAKVPYFANNEHTLWALHAQRPAGHTLIGRFIDDSAPRPLYSAWYRIMCTDQRFREWGQPFFAL